MRRRLNYSAWLYGLKLLQLYCVHTSSCCLARHIPLPSNNSGCDGPVCLPTRSLLRLLYGRGSLYLILYDHSNQRKVFSILIATIMRVVIELIYKNFCDISSSSPLTVLNSNQFYHRKSCLACGDCRAEASRAHAFKVELGQPTTTMIWRETLRRKTLLLGKIIRHSWLGCF